MTDEKDIENLDLSEFNFDDLLGSENPTNASDTDNTNLDLPDFNFDNLASSSIDENQQITINDFVQEQEPTADSSTDTNISLTSADKTDTTTIDHINDFFESSATTEAVADSLPDTTIPPQSTQMEQNNYFTDDSIENHDIPPVDCNNYSAAANIISQQTSGFIRWYSGVSTLPQYEIDKDFESATFVADENCKIIHVNVGFDTYGWEVQFADGIIMNLHDVREYQLRNGSLPHSEGRIIYGKSVLMFSNVEKIVVYKSARYFSYGA